MRLILYTGKGGVGKSSMSAATAALCALRGHRTLLVSSDLAHNLSDIFARPVGAEPTALAERLWALEVDPLEEIRSQWGSMQDYWDGLLVYLGMEDAAAEEMALLPAVDDAFMLTRILREAETGEYDAVVVDCAPTGATLRLLTLLDSGGARLLAINEAKRRFAKLVRPFSRIAGKTGRLIPSDECFEAGGDVLLEMGRLAGLMRDPGLASVRLVLNPERIAVAETRRAFTYFGLFGFPVDGVFVNKVLPAELADGYLGQWYTLQREQLDLISRAFLHLPVFHVPQLADEPVGIAALQDMAARIYGDRDPLPALAEAGTVQLKAVGTEREVRFPLPGLRKDELDVEQQGGELFIRAGASSRVYILPDSLARAEVRGATYEDGILALRLG